MKLLDQKVAPLGLGCWPIGGAMWSADGDSLGYTGTCDKESVKAIHAAIDQGIKVFDTAAAYGTGHSERLLATALEHHPDCLVISKIGLAIDEKNRTLLGEDADPASVMPAIEACLKRLKRDTVDVILLHLNDLSPDKAGPLFDEMDKARDAGRIRAYGWSTDFTRSVEQVAGREGFEAVEHAMHVFMDAPAMQALLHRTSIAALIRSPLAMGLLSGKYRVDHQLPKDDIRARDQGWIKYYINGKPNPDFIKRFEAVQDLLTTNGRTPAQGALGWLWAKSPNNLALPGARTVKQVVGLGGALQHGALPQGVMEEIDALIGQDYISTGDSPR